jgi:hypothetical protein
MSPDLGINTSFDRMGILLLLQESEKGYTRFMPVFLFPQINMAVP